MHDPTSFLFVTATCSECSILLVLLTRQTRSAQVITEALMLVLLRDSFLFFI